jgi:4-hydroxy-tetrahydrodipicolinate synthase
MDFDLSGTGVSLAIPFHRHGTVDFTSFEKLIEHTIDGGVDYIAALSNFNESFTLSANESLAVLNFVIETINNRLPLVVGIKGSNTQNLADTIKKMNFNGIQAIIPFCPCMGNIQQKGIYYHFREMTANCPVPFLINTIGMTICSEINIETIVQIAKEFGNICGILSVFSNAGRILDIKSKTPKGFKLVTSSDINIIPTMAAGADGVLSLAANAFPQEIKTVVDCCTMEKFSCARNSIEPLLPILEIMEQEDQTPALKAILDILGICSNNLRLPLVKLKKSLLFNLQGLLENHETLKMAN